MDLERDKLIISEHAVDRYLTRVEVKPIAEVRKIITKMVRNSKQLKMSYEDRLYQIKKDGYSKDKRYRQYENFVIVLDSNMVKTIYDKEVKV